MTNFQQIKMEFELAYNDAVEIVNEISKLVNQYNETPWGTNITDDEKTQADGIYLRFSPLTQEATTNIEAVWKDYKYMLNGVAVKKVSKVDANWEIIVFSQRLAEHIGYMVQTGLPEMARALDLKIKSLEV